MRCATCGSPTDLEDLEVNGLLFHPDGHIAGTVSTKMRCPRCGTAGAVLAVRIDVHVPSAHQAAGHHLEIDFEPTAFAFTTKHFPVRVHCSCGAMDAHGVMTIERDQ